MDAPSKATEIKAILTAALAFLTALWGWLGWMILLFICSIFLDYLTGSWAAKAKGEWSSTIAREGLWHKLGEIVALLVAALCDIAIQVILQSTAAPLIGEITYGCYLTMIVAIWYIFTEAGSICENAEELGAKVPKWLTTGIGRLQQKADSIEPLGGSGEDEPHGKHEAAPVYGEEVKDPDEYEAAAKAEGGDATLEEILELLKKDE